MEKAEYIIKSLSKTKRKDWENYVINRLWNKLDDDKIKPVTQQYVRVDGKYYYIDLYFPQFEIGIECDEPHHLTEEDKDKLRSEDIMNVIDKYKEIRIEVFDNDEIGDKCYKSIKELNKDIDNAVSEIKEAKKRKVKEGEFVPWTEVSDFNRAMKKGVIKVSDNYYLFDQEEVRKFFDRKGKCYGRCYYEIDNSNGNHIWMPYLAIKDNGIYYRPKNKPYLNVLSSNGLIIYESIEKEKSDIKPECFQRYVFARYKDEVLKKYIFKFLGVFESSGEIEYLDIEGKGEKAPYVIHHRTGTEVKKIER